MNWVGSETCASYQKKTKTPPTHTHKKTHQKNPTKKPNHQPQTNKKPTNHKNKTKNAPQTQNTTWGEHQCTQRTVKGRQYTAGWMQMKSSWCSQSQREDMVLGKTHNSKLFLEIENKPYHDYHDWIWTLNHPQLFPKDVWELSSPSTAKRSIPTFPKAVDVFSYPGFHHSLLCSNQGSQNVLHQFSVWPSQLHGDGGK